MRVCVRLYVYMCVRMCVCVICHKTHCELVLRSKILRMYVCMYVCESVCMYVKMCVCVYMYVCIL